MFKRPGRAKNTDLGLRQVGKVKEREAYALPVQRCQLKLKARMDLSRREGKEEKANKASALGRKAR